VENKNRRDHGSRKEHMNMAHLSRVFTTAAAALAAITLAVPATGAASALADPPAGVTPRSADMVGVGSGILQYLFDQYGHDYNTTVSAKAPHLYSFDAIDPISGLAGGRITTKRGCKAISRPSDSSSGITALAKLNAKTAGHPCIDYARSYRGRLPTDPPFGRGGVAFVYLMYDGDTWATPRVTDAPRSLTTAQLRAIYTCKVNNWARVGGKNARIRPFLPPPGTDKRFWFLKEIEIVAPGTCVSNAPRENFGASKLLGTPNVIVPYSIANYIAQRFHSAKCLLATCMVPPSSAVGRICVPAKGQNLFGCDTHGTLVLHSINRIQPTVGGGTKTRINPKFPAAFIQAMYEVVPFSNAKGNVNHIPPSLAKIFGPFGFVCHNRLAASATLNYGFSPNKKCGKTV
jgi:hypothetical protein